jgi:PhoPQ-activated pathogenicity-related protein
MHLMRPHTIPFTPSLSRTILGLLLVVGLRLPAADDKPNALEKYIRAPDPTFAWKVSGRSNLTAGVATHLEVTSQTWRSHVWSHHVRVVRPTKVRNADIAFLFVTGDGSGRSSLGLCQTLAERAGAVAAVVTRVPNQPLYDGRQEDALIAFTFDQYLKSDDDTWPLLFPMVKSAVRAMDAVQEWAGREHGQTLERWVVGGASKRGWTTWLTGAVDPRVKGIAPMVIDMLNMSAQTAWAKKVYGRQSEQIHDYTELGLIEKMGEPAMVTLRSWVDPYSYRNRYTMPKLILIGTNDPYWTVDSLRHYWGDLPEPKLVYQTPNAGHDLGGGRSATQTLAAFFQAIADGTDLPRAEWARQNGGSELSVRWGHPPRSARVWTADSADRDFRDDQWSSRELPLRPGARSVTVPLGKPPTGYRAHLVESTQTASDGREFHLSTEVCVMPDEVATRSGF